MPHQFHLKGHPEILIVSNIIENGQPVGLGDAGHFWHSDLSYKETPSLGSMLLAQELPSEGGDTLFADQHAAWIALPLALKQCVRNLQAEHSYLAKYEELRERSPWRPALSDEQVAHRAAVGAYATGDRPGRAYSSASISRPHRRHVRERKPRAAGQAIRLRHAT